MRISDYDYQLPKEQIAIHPPKQRGKSRLLALDRQSGAIEHRRYSGLTDYLEPGDVLVLNNTRVIKARLVAQNSQGQDRELLLLETHATDTDPKRRLVMHRGKLLAGEVLKVGPTELRVKHVSGHGIAEISADVELLTLADTAGSVPLPPYIHRQATAADIVRYQTVFAQAPGSVAAPTASLNFTDELRAALEARGIIIAPLTLHVGLGTFLPIRSDEVEKHIIHSEYFEIPAATVQAIRQAKENGRRITALGTTVARTLEYASNELLKQASAASITGEADIFIYPGYRFKVVDQLITNFHAPRSTVLMLAAAFAGWNHLKAAYAEAIKEKYHFLSYGDSMIIR